jgi:predicted 3-demethylubiquinone-9 3-methyltransferase (glyoxalase superfamily)
MKKISHCLWFDNQAEEAARFYTSVFPDGKIGRVSRFGNEGQEIHGQPPGRVMTVEFEIAGLPYLALNGGPLFKFNEAFSIVVTCDTQEEIDDLWTKLTEGGGQDGPCGWLRDKFGVSWQLAPRVLPELIAGDQARADRVMKAMLSMKKLDIAALRAAAEGKS